MIASSGHSLEDRVRDMNIRSSISTLQTIKLHLRFVSTGHPIHLAQPWLDRKDTEDGLNQKNAVRRQTAQSQVSVP